jgi:diamine N-acetyltransferase
LHPITISRAGTSDVDTIVSMSRQTFSETFASANTAEDMQQFMDGEFSVANLTADANNPVNHFFLARVQDSDVGYMKLVPGNLPSNASFSNALEISRIYVLKSSIGLGVGRRLMEFAIHYAEEQHFDHIWLGVWEHNVRAINFYQSFGFERFGQHDFFLGSDRQTDWLMVRSSQ